MENFGYVKKISDNQFIVKADVNRYGTGYGVVPRDEDPDNLYDIAEVREYVSQHPEMLFDRYADEQTDSHKQLIDELANHESWLFEVYDMQVKQYQRCVRLGQAYDCKYGTIIELDSIAEQKVRRINEIKNILNQQ